MRSSQISLFLKNKMEKRGFWCVTSLSLILFLCTLSNHFSGGSLEFASEIEGGNWKMLLQPQKLLIHPMGWLFYQTWRFFGWQGNSLLPSQILNAIFGAFAVGLMFHVTKRITDSLQAAYWIAFGSAVSCGIWVFSTEAEFVTPALVSMLLVILYSLFVFQKKDTGTWRFLGLGLFTGLSIMVYITNIFFLAAQAGTILYLFFRQRKIWIKDLLALLLGVFLVVVPVFTVLLHNFYDVNSFSDLQGFHLYGGRGAGVGIVYGILSWKNIYYGAYAFLKTLTTFPGLGLDTSTQAFWSFSGSYDRTLFVLFTLARGIILFFVLFLVFLRRRNLFHTYSMVLIFLGIWTFQNIIFGFYWVPKDIQFWMPVIMAWWLVAGIAIFSNQNKLVLSRGVTSVGLVLLPIVLFFTNGVGLIWPNHNIETNLAYQTAKIISNSTNATDKIITVEEDYYIPFFSHRSTISIFREMVAPGATYQQVFQNLQKEIESALSDGGKVYLLEYPAPEDPIWDPLNKVGLQYEDQKFFITEDYKQVSLNRKLLLITGTRP